MTLDEALARPISGDGVLTIRCRIAVLWANDQVILTVSDDSFDAGGQRIPVRDGEWIRKEMSRTLSPYVGGSVAFVEACEITCRLDHRNGTPEVTDVSRCVIRGEELDDFDNPVPFELILNRNGPAS